MEEKKIAVFPGSFNPFTIGHKAILDMALPLFDKVIIAIGVNDKKYNNRFEVDRNVETYSEVFKDNPKVEVRSYNTLTADFCKEVGAKWIVRGARNLVDFEYEKTMAHANKILMPELDTIIFPTPAELALVSSSFVRDIMKYNPRKAMEYMVL